VFINVSEYRAVATYSEAELQVIPKHLKYHAKLQHVLIQKQ
jgi:hypothetical protein